MSSPYRLRGDRGEASPPDAPPPASPKRSLGGLRSTHPAEGPIDTLLATALVGGRKIELRTFGIVVFGWLTGRKAIFFEDIDALFYDFGDSVEGPKVSIRVTTFGGESITLPRVRSPMTLLDALDTAVTAPLIAPAKEALLAGEPLVFGPLRVELDGVRLRGEPLPWSQLPRVIVRRAALALHGPDTKGLWAEPRVEELPHVRVLLEVLRMRTKVIEQETLVDGW